MSSSRKPQKEKTYWCSCSKCHGGKAVSKGTFYGHGNSVKRTSQGFSERTRDLILSLPETSKATRARRPRKPHTNRVASAGGDSPEGSITAARSDSVRLRLDSQYMRLKLTKSVSRVLGLMQKILNSTRRTKKCSRTLVLGAHMSPSPSPPPALYPLL